MQIYDWSNWSPDMNDPSTFVALACVWLPLAKPNASAAASARKTEKFEYLALALALELSLHEARLHYKIRPLVPVLAAALALVLLLKNRL